jgi:GxxExxY protein
MAQSGESEALGKRDHQTYSIIGAAMEVHRTLGPGFLESVYQSALELEFGERGVPYVRETEVSVHYKGRVLGVRFRADFICYGGVLVELKALNRLTTNEDSQIINYLVAGKLGRGILHNFGAASLQFRRFVGPEGPTLISSVQSVDAVVPAR